VRRYINVHCITTHGLIDCGHLDFNNSKVVELHRCNLSNSDWNPWVGKDVAGASVRPNPLCFVYRDCNGYDVNLEAVNEVRQDRMANA
jgi:hypothetical protein